MYLPLIGINLDVGDVAAMFVGRTKEANVLCCEIWIESGDKDRRAEGFGEAGGVVPERVPWRSDIIGVELGLSGPR